MAKNFKKEEEEIDERNDDRFVNNDSLVNDEPPLVPEPKPFKPEHPDAWLETKPKQLKKPVDKEPVRGILYSADPKSVSLMNENGMPCHTVSLVDDGCCEVCLCGVETTLDDLKRGDLVTLYGDPVSKIDAYRK